MGLPQWVSRSACNAGDRGDMDSIPESGRSPGVGNGNPVQYHCLGNPLDRGAWWATVQRVAGSDTTEPLSMHASYVSIEYLYILVTFLFYCTGSSLLLMGFLSLQCAGLSLWWLLLLQSRLECTGFSSCGTWVHWLRFPGSLVAVPGLIGCGSRALEHRLNSCGIWA